MLSGVMAQLTEKIKAVTATASPAVIDEVVLGPKGQ
jgi:hypothetical protein